MKNQKMNTNRRHNGGGANPHERKTRQAEALGRQDAYNDLTLQQKISALPPEPFSKKQRARLLALLDGSAKPKAAPKKEVAPAPVQNDTVDTTK
jgi:hypothetical protein